MGKQEILEELGPPDHRFSSFADFYNAYLLPQCLPKGVHRRGKHVVATHRQLFGRRHPSDAPYIAAALADPSKSFIGPEYQKIGTRLKLGQIMLHRDVLVDGPPGVDSGYDAEYVELSVRDYVALQYQPGGTGIERTRFAWSEPTVRELERICGADSPLFRLHAHGRETGQPGASYWKSALVASDGSQEIQAFALMNYLPRLAVDIFRADGRQGIPRPLEEYDDFFDRVFADDDLSLSLPAFRAAAGLAPPQ